MATVTYTLTFRKNGDPTAATGLTPSFVLYTDIDTGNAITPETITEIGSGHYKFTVDWDAAKYNAVNSIAVVIDGGATLTSASERYITSRIDRQDSYIDLIFQINTGKWEVSNNQLTLYGLDQVTVVQRFNLFDSDNQPTSTNPAKRVPV